jgi:hypothetical protein
MNPEEEVKALQKYSDFRKGTAREHSRCVKRWAWEPSSAPAPRPWRPGRATDIGDLDPVLGDAGDLDDAAGVAPDDAVTAPEREPHAELRGGPRRRNWTDRTVEQTHDAPAFCASQCASGGRTGLTSPEASQPRRRDLDTAAGRRREPGHPSRPAFGSASRR